MTYNKPHDVSYTQMAIWIDNNAYLEDCDECILYEYLYHLLFMIAHEHKYFRFTHQYDDYALRGASKLFLRLKDPRQFEENSPLTKIKSILNYIKTVSYPYKIDFEQETYSENPEGNVVIHTDTSNINDYIAEECEIFNKIDFESSIYDIPNIIKSYLKKTIRLRNNSDIKNIYLSCLLTILNSITCSQAELRKYNHKTIDRHIDRIYKEMNSQDPMLYHLPYNMTNYIKVLVKELQNVIAKELSIETYSKISSEISIKNLIIASMEEKWD